MEAKKRQSEWPVWLTVFVAIAIGAYVAVYLFVVAPAWRPRLAQKSSVLTPYRPSAKARAINRSLEIDDEWIDPPRNQILQILFAPAHEIDKRVRRAYWD